MEPRGIESTDGRQQWSINVMLGLTRRIESSNIQSVMEDVRETAPAGYVPIAVGEGGEIVLLKLVDPSAGTVLLWQWDLDNFRLGQRALFALGDSFTEFFHGIRHL